MSKDKSVPKFKIGEIIWYIKSSYLNCDKIKGIFLDKYDEVNIAVDTPTCNGNTYSIPDSYVLNQNEVFPTREALLKHLKDEEVEIPE